jgi:hypothetical protein
VRKSAACFWLAFLAPVAAVEASCGLDQSGSLDAFPLLDGSTGPPNGRDSGADVPVFADGNTTPDAFLKDATVVDGPAVDAPPDALPDVPGADAQDSGINCTPNDTTQCYVLPSGWSVVGFATVQNVNCPSGFTTNRTDGNEGPTPSAGACTCGGCTVSTQPSCTTGQIPDSYDLGGGGCALPGQTLQNAGNGACATDNYHGMLGNIDLQIDALPSSGGTCAAPAQPHANQITYGSQDRVCYANDPASAGCDPTTGVCTAPTVPSPYAVCIAQTGDVLCPSGPFQVKHVVGQGVTFTCSACNCTVQGSCSGAKVTFYTDANCSQGAVADNADGNCNAFNANNAAFGSYQYTANLGGVGCQVPGGQTPAVQSLSLTSPMTICCAQ